MFVAIEGFRGAGKTSLANQLSWEIGGYHGENTNALLLTRDIGGTLMGEWVRDEFFSDGAEYELDVMTELLLVHAARREHVTRKIKPALDADKLVICDEFFARTFVEYCYIESIHRSAVLDMHERYCQNLFPNVTFLLDCDVHTALTRLQKVNRIGRTVSSTQHYIKAVKDGFHQFYKDAKDSTLDMGHLYRIDTDDSIDVIAQRCMQVIELLKVGVVPSQDDVTNNTIAA